MKKFDRCAAVNQDILSELAKIPDNQKAGSWDKPDNENKDNIAKFKRRIKDEGMKIQDQRCAWCGLLIGKKGRRTAHRDHIAPKKLNPEWTYLPLNLVMACEYCNGFAVKSDIDTVKVKSQEYKDCDFYVVHPYLEDPGIHIEIFDDVFIKHKTPKGDWTIKNLKLDGTELALERAKDVLIKNKNELPARYRKLIEAVINNDH